MSEICPSATASGPGQPSPEKQTCFVIMPFSQTSDAHTEDYWTKHFDVFLKSCIEKGGRLIAKRSAALRGDVLKALIADAITARVVVADLTDHNPNVFWELGVRQSFKHGTITIAEFGTKLPFDLSTKGTLFYHPSNHLRNAAFITDFGGALDHALDHPDHADSIVLETTSGRGSLFEMFQRQQAIRRLEALLFETEDNLRACHNCESWCHEHDPKREPEAFTRYLGQLRTGATELLLNERYLDSEVSLYGVLECTLAGTAAINQLIREWGTNREGTVPQLLERVETYRSLGVLLKRCLRAQLQRLRLQCISD